MRILFSLTLGLFAFSCAKQAAPPTDHVDPAKVQSIVFAQSLAEQRLCEAEVIAHGGRVLYIGEDGLLFTDRSAEELGLTNCSAMVIKNERVKIAPREDNAESSVDLPTLMRLLPAEEIGARTFIKNNPTFDGRGVTIAVLDTGIELDHPMLSQLPDGKRKIVGFEDFSGQGTVALTTAAVVDGKINFRGKSYAISGGHTKLNIGIFNGSALNQGTDASSGDKFIDVGVVTYEKGTQWVGKIDTDGDLSFDDEVELSNYADSLAFTKLGKKRTLTTALNIRAKGMVASLAFDDGSHGTHVGGIAAGYDPKGLVGVAPGARIICGKIGDGRLAGGSTTTASKLLAIDYAVREGAQVVNISYGILGGSNMGQSAIDKYVDKIAKEKGILFAISAGNSGPGITTIGTPAGARLAISPGAYVSKETARDNYGYLGVERDNVWWFSSVGPMAGGGMKPSIIAPGSALSALPNFTGGYETYRGTSMAAPQVAGGLALLLSAAQQSQLPTDRVSVTQAVYRSADKVPGLMLIEQGHGLMNVPKALTALKRAKGQTRVEYRLSVASPTSPTGRGAGIYIRSGKIPVNDFRVSVTAELATSTPNFLRTFKLEPSADWIEAPPNFWMHSATKAFNVRIDQSVAKKPGLYSESINAIDETTGELAFVVPVTVVVPLPMTAENAYTQVIESTIGVGEVQRFFIDVPAGTTAVQLDLETDGPSVYGQLLDAEGREVDFFYNSGFPMPSPPILRQANVTKGGVFELDLNARAFLPRPAKIKATVKLFSLSTHVVALDAKATEVTVQNNFSTVHVTPKVDFTTVRKQQLVTVTGDSTVLDINWTKDDTAKYGSLDFRVQTAKKFYDQMTDYPYTIFCPDGKLLDYGGFDWDSKVHLTKVCEGQSKFTITGAFTHEKPKSWAFRLTEDRVFKNPISIFSGSSMTLAEGQERPLEIDTSKVVADSGQACATLTLSDFSKRKVQDIVFCP